jgi:hypothetical protein
MAEAGIWINQITTRWAFDNGDVDEGDRAGVYSRLLATAVGHMNALRLARATVAELLAVWPAATGIKEFAHRENLGCHPQAHR